MSDEELLSVGRFAKLAGLSTHTLRHYDSVGLLRPVQVDPDTGYRLYSPEQLVTARQIKDLRWLDVPIQHVREIVRSPRSDQARRLLARHANRLARHRRQVTRQLEQCNRYAAEGVDMPTPVTSIVPVQIKVGVQDLSKAKAFYEAAFGLGEIVIRSTDDADYTGYRFGTYGQPGFFLIVLVGPDAFDHPERSTFGLNVPDLDAAHRRALEAGGIESVPIASPQGMPRNSAVKDPDDNWIWLYQG